MYGCVQVHKTERARVCAIRLLESACRLAVCACILVHGCVCYEYLMCYSVFMRLNDREKQRGRRR